MSRKYKFFQEWRKLSPAMTLAEVLITIMIIGIMAVLILPTLRSDIDDKVFDSAKKVFESKFTGGLHKMRIKGDLGKRYETTLDFANALADYMKVGSICTKSNLSSCFADKINGSSTSVLYNTKDLETTEDLGARFKADLVAMTFGDGTTALLGYNPDCLITDIYNSNADVTECLVMIYDTNSKNAPNILSFDMASMNLSTEEPDFEIGEIFSPTPLSIEECRQFYLDGGPMNYMCEGEPDYWAGAVKKCYDEGKRLPTPDELTQIASQLYGQTIPSFGQVGNLEIADRELWLDLGGRDIGFWSSLEYSFTISYGRPFSSSSTCYDSYHRTGSGCKAFCISD